MRVLECLRRDAHVWDSVEFFNLVLEQRLSDTDKQDLVAFLRAL